MQAIIRQALVAVCWGFAVSATAVPDQLDSYSRPLTRIYHDFVRQDSRIAANKQYVRSVVKYSVLRSSPPWAQYIHDLAYVNPITLKQASENGRKAFWVNTYNSFVIDAVATHYPLPFTSVNEYPA